MFIEAIQQHIAVCAQKDLPNYTKRDAGFWNLISIREPKRPKIDPNGFKKIQKSIFHDVAGLEGLDDSYRWVIPNEGHIQEIMRFADDVWDEPILIHCWEGKSRSTAVALALIVRGMHSHGSTTDEIIKDAPEHLIAIRPRSVPNHLVLTLALKSFLDDETADYLVHQLLHHPVLFANRYPGASPSE